MQITYTIFIKIIDILFKLKMILKFKSLFLLKINKF